MGSGTVVTIQQPSLTYPIRVGAGLLSQAGLFLQEVTPQAQRVLVVSDSVVGPLYQGTVCQHLEGAGFQVALTLMDTGEAHKTLETLAKLYDFALDSGLNRNDTIVALGGGIVGDLTGFLAATYLRGLAFVQIPTTLLAQVDASVGGKVGFNWQHYKNMVGAFYQPKGVLIDTATLKTLSTRDFACGMAEVVKTALLEATACQDNPTNETLLSQLQQGPDGIASRLSAIIARCCRIKADIVERDPQERHGVREILNLGHTFGHAYETLSQGEILHGEAVSIGIVQAFRLAVIREQITEEALETVTRLLEIHNLPTTPPPAFSSEDLIHTMRRDKKALSSQPFRLVLPYKALGQVRVEAGVSEEELKQVLAGS